MIEKPRRRWGRWLLLALLAIAAFLGTGYYNATRDPIVRTATIEVEGMPRDKPPLSVLLLSDLHVAGPDMPPERLEHIVRQLNELRPDLVLIAGDLVSEKRTATHIYRPEEIVRPLGLFATQLGVVVAPGNHDHWFDPKALRSELEKLGIHVLQNEAIKLGPFIIGGVDDDFSHHADIPKTFAAMNQLGEGVPLIVSHSPDIVPALPARVAAVFAGHTHCGQIRFPVIGALSYVSRYGDRFACGDITDKGQRVFVGAGLGTSILPLRFGTPPDVWLVKIGPKRTVTK